MSLTDSENSLAVAKEACTQAAILRSEFAMIPVKHLKAIMELAWQYIDLKE